VKFDPARFASIRNRQGETPVGNDLSRLDEIQSAPCGVLISPDHKIRVAQSRAAIEAADSAKKPAAQTIAPVIQSAPVPEKSLAERDAAIAEEKEAAELAAMEANYAYPPKSLITPEEAKANALANVARARAFHESKNKGDSK